MEVTLLQDLLASSSTMAGRSEALSSFTVLNVILQKEIITVCSLSKEKRKKHRVMKGSGKDSGEKKWIMFQCTEFTA